MVGFVVGCFLEGLRVGLREGVRVGMRGVGLRMGKIVGSYVVGTKGMGEDGLKDGKPVPIHPKLSNIVRICSWIGGHTDRTSSPL